jgi:hypothetical protein
MISDLTPGSLFDTAAFDFLDMLGSPNLAGPMARAGDAALLEEPSFSQLLTGEAEWGVDAADDMASGGAGFGNPDFFTDAGVMLPQTSGGGLDEAGLVLRMLQGEGPAAGAFGWAVSVGPAGGDKGRGSSLVVGEEGEQTELGSRHGGQPGGLPLGWIFGAAPVLLDSAAGAAGACCDGQASGPRWAGVAPGAGAVALPVAWPVAVPWLATQATAAFEVRLQLPATPAPLAQVGELQTGWDGQAGLAGAIANSPGVAPPLGGALAGQTDISHGPQMGEALTPAEGGVASLEAADSSPDAECETGQPYQGRGFDDLKESVSPREPVEESGDRHQRRGDGMGKQDTGAERETAPGGFDLPVFGAETLAEAGPGGGFERALAEGQGRSITARPRAEGVSGASVLADLRQSALPQTPVSNLVIELDAASGPPVRLRLQQADGPVRIEVHSPLAEVRSQLTGGLDQLVGQLEVSGYTDVTARAGTASLSPAQAEGLPAVWGLTETSAGGAGQEDPGQPGEDTAEEDSDRRRSGSGRGAGRGKPGVRNAGPVRWSPFAVEPLIGAGTAGPGK